MQRPVNCHRPARWLAVASVAIVLTFMTAAILAAPPTSQPGGGKSVLVPAAGSDKGSGGGDVIQELHFRDLDLASALRMVTMQTRDNVVLSGKVDGSQKVEANLYNVTFDQVLDSILTPLGLAYVRKENFIYVYTKKEMEELTKAAKAVASTVFKLHYITAADASVMIKPLLSPLGQVSATAAAVTGIESGSASTGGNSYATDDALVVTDSPENLQVIGKVLKELDVRPRQVLVEATILNATLDETNALGIDFNTLGGIDFASLGGASSSGSGGTGGTGGSSSSGTATPSYPSGSSKVDGDLARTDFNKTTFNAKTDFLQDFAPGGFSFGIVTNNVAAFVRALEQVTDTTVVANPKVLALNKQRGEVIVGRRDGYLTTIRTETESYQKVEFLETGVQLRFRPFIAEDGYVRMELHPGDSSGSITAANLPTEETTEVTTNLIVKDGHTVVIGGLFRESTKAARSQVPWLGNIPYAGVLFRTRSDTVKREEVIILLTVHIIENNQAYAEVGEKALEDIERISVGARQSLMPQSSERLAQAHYKWALQHIEAGRMDKGLWDLNMALRLSPRFMDAINKKEELTHRRAWESNFSLTRNFIYNHVIGAEDKWVDTLGPPPAPGTELSPPPDRDSNEWGSPVRSMGGRATSRPEQTLYPKAADQGK
ncbi:MAG: secretin and TonB N-terminal domain-containing protein [Phycisphaerae bacterium]|nr:secretin and TonB N-terminal domain-containing protein [Phycisphaerae bacterium]